MIVRRLQAPLDVALAKAATDLAAAPADSSEEWQLPDGDHALAAAVSIDVTGREVRLRGSDAVKLAFAAGGLQIKASAVEIIELSIDSAAGNALTVAAQRISLQDVDAAATNAGGAIAVDLGALDGTIDVEDLVISRASGGDAIGLRAIGGALRVTGVDVSGVAGKTAVGVRLGALRDAEAVELELEDITATGDTAVGALIAAGGRIEVARIRCTGLDSAGETTGIAVLGFGPGTESVSVVDLDVVDATAAGDAIGIMVAVPRKLTVRGLTVADVTGKAAAGAIVVGGSPTGAITDVDDPEVEVGFGTVDRIVSTAGNAAGMRIIATPSPRPVIVRDLAIAEVAGPPVPGDAVPPRDGDGEPAWQTWATELLADLADDALPRADVPALLAEADVVGLSVTAMVDDVQPFLDEIAAGDLAIIDSRVRTVSGSAIQAETGLRPMWLRRTEVSTALHAGYLQADQLVIANTTWDRLNAPLVIGPGEVRAYDSLWTRIPSATGPITLDPDADWVEGKAVYADTATDKLDAVGALPYVTPGATTVPASLAAGALPPPETIDLHLVAGSTLHSHAVAPPPDDLDVSDDDRLFVGAHPPDAAVPCTLYDPLPPAAGARPLPARQSPVVDYRARDAKRLLDVMLRRAEQVMPTWTDRGPADFTTMLLETVAERLDHIAYKQERAVAEGFLEDARLRRSVEDHVRPLDYDVDPGLSATAMLRFHLDLGGIAGVIKERTSEAAKTSDAARKAWLQSTIAALTALADDGALEIPAGTLAANGRNDDQVLVFATEEPLAYFPKLDAVLFEKDVPAGATSAVLLGNFPGLAIGRWLVLWRGQGRGGHVVRITTLVHGTDTIQIGWDPRRPLPWPLNAKADPETGAPAAVVLGNVVPAQHGVPLSTIGDDIGNPDLERFRNELRLVVDGGPGVELALPFGPISLHAPGFPLPSEEHTRRGTPRVRVLVENDEWRRADELATAAPGDEVFVLRTSADGRATLRFGDGVAGSALPARQNRIRLDLTVGAGRGGNVGERILRRLLFVPVEEARGPITGWLFREDMDVIRGLLTVDNPIPTVGGRDPESLDRIRYRAPLCAQRPESAITPDDYARVARSVSDVAGAHARMMRGAVRPVVHVTVLLRDEDTLDPDERLRRWAAVRAALEHARLLGYDVESVPPTWVPLDLDIVVDAHPHADAGTVREAVIAAVSGDGGLLDPDTSGLGGDVQLADLYRAVLGAHGVAAARVRRFRRLRRHAPERLHAGFIQIGPDEVAIVRGPARPASDGVLTVTVCGGLR